MANPATGEGSASQSVPTSVRTAENVPTWSLSPKSRSQIKDNFQLVAEEFSSLKEHVQKLQDAITSNTTSQRELMATLNGEATRNQALYSQLAALRDDMNRLQLKFGEMERNNPFPQSARQENTPTTLVEQASPFHPANLFAGEAVGEGSVSGPAQAPARSVSFAVPGSTPEPMSVSLGHGSKKAEDPPVNEAPAAPEEVKTADISDGAFQKFAFYGFGPSGSLGTGGTLGGGLNLSFMKGPKLTNYSGAGDAEKWLDNCEAFMEGHGLPPTHFRVCIPKIRLFLEGMAKQWYTATFRDQPLPTWHAFRTSLIAEFKGEDKAKTAREKLAKMVQLDTIPKYISYFRSIRRDIPDLEDREAYHAFRRGLKRHLLVEVEKVEAMKGDEMGLLQLQQYVAEMERLIDAPKGKGTTTSQKTANLKGGGISTAGKQDYGKPTVQERQPSQSSSPRKGSKPPLDKSKMVCYNCGKSGHSAKECRAPKKVGASGGPPKK